MNSIKRWWQGRGFGIQSKSDYEYLKDVLKEPLPYYAYEEIKGDRARLIYRVCNRDRRRKVVFVGEIPMEERLAAEKALGRKPDIVSTLNHLHKQDTVIISSITGENRELWNKALGARAITWDMGDLGLVRFLKDRYPEHYTI